MNNNVCKISYCFIALLTLYEIFGSEIGFPLRDIPLLPDVQLIAYNNI